MAENKTNRIAPRKALQTRLVATEGPPTEDLGRGLEALLSSADWVVRMVYRINLGYVQGIHTRTAVLVYFEADKIRENR